MKVLFLDVDGVLNSVNNLSYLAISKPMLRRLRRVIEATKCEVVLSSTWRKLPDTRIAFKKKTLINVFDYTPCHNDGFRGGEIKAWLEEYPKVTRYAIVDDDGDMLPEQLPFFVQTSVQTGLLDHHADKLIEILNANLADPVGHR